MTSPKLIAILGSAAASLTLGIAFLEPHLKPANVPDAIVVAALFLQPALLMILPRRRASLDLGAGILAALLGVGSLLIPYAIQVPWAVMAALFTIACAIGALTHNSMAPETKGDGPIAVLVVLLSVGALFATGIASHPMCRTAPMESVCVDDATSYVGAAATALALWLGSALVWLAARKPPVMSAVVRQPSG